MKELKVKRFNSLIEKTIGLINSEEAYPVLLKTRFGIHTFFMKYAIDILIIDSEKKVMKMHTNLYPNRIFIWHPKYDTVIELPAGYIKKYDIHLGDTLKLIF